MKTTTLQIPMQTTLRDLAAKVAAKQGFSSLQEVIRVFINQFAQGQIEVRFIGPVLKQSVKNE